MRLQANDAQLQEGRRDRLDGRPPVTLRAGEALFIPAGGIHAVKNVGGGNGAELATYIVEKGKPLLTLAK
jgi:quercetin dioxygenase-like cupin family protein